MWLDSYPLAGAGSPPPPTHGGGHTPPQATLGVARRPLEVGETFEATSMVDRPPQRKPGLAHVHRQPMGVVVGHPGFLLATPDPPLQVAQRPPPTLCGPRATSFLLLFSFLFPFFKKKIIKV
jgi:hypothetical protein